jgi:hypothetical protein
VGGAIKSTRNFFSIYGLVPHEFVPPGKIVTGYFYVQVLQKKRSDKWQAGTAVSASR